ncbi:Zinc finger protein 821 [Frankliniella fusca]|uniref:Zinc finger protein 821 n=1 Tax=Frankliniella fusca TaxID=407009 RepID=A0AAE1HCZ7_9NEOP|nr:Zinc finger protein 821 [Frankliniella fusca]
MLMEDPNKASTLMWSPPRPSSVEARRLRNAASNQAARARETPEACAVRRQQNAIRMEVLRGQESEEKAAERRAKNAQAMQAARARETPEQTAARRAQNAARMVALRARETPEQRAARRSLNAARMQASAARAKETLQDGGEGVGLKVFLDDEVMRRAVLAAHKQPLKKRKDREILIMDLDRQEGQRQHVVERAEIASPTLHSQGNVIEGREATNKFSYEVE